MAENEEKIAEQKSADEAKKVYTRLDSLDDYAEEYAEAMNRQDEVIAGNEKLLKALNESNNKADLEPLIKTMTTANDGAKAQKELYLKKYNSLKTITSVCRKNPAMNDLLESIFFVFNIERK